MSCLVEDKFVMNKGMDNEFVIKIKQNNTTLPMTINTDDTFVVKLYRLEDNIEVAEVTLVDDATTGKVEVTDALNGQITITFYQTLVDSLTTERGDKSDYYYAKATHRIAIVASTISNGNFIANIDKVYVR